MCPRADHPDAGAAGWAGAGLFAVVVIWAGWIYLSAFADVPGRWTWQTGLPAVAGNAVLFSVFALHHSIFARAGLKSWLTSHLPPRLERTTYVVVASVLFALVLWLWRPVPGLAWEVTGVFGLCLLVGQAGGVLITVHVVRRMDALAFAGVRSRPAARSSDLRASGLYGLVRHPLYFAWLLMVWPAPVMTGSRLTFAAVSTLYLVLAIPFEERSLGQEFGAAYDDYRRRVRWRLLPGIY